MSEEDENRFVMFLIALGLFLVWLMSAILLYRFEREQRQEALHDLFFSVGDCSTADARRGAEALAESIVRGDR